METKAGHNSHSRLAMVGSIWVVPTGIEVPLLAGAMVDGSGQDFPSWSFGVVDHKHRVVRVTSSTAIRSHRIVSPWSIGIGWRRNHKLLLPWRRRAIPVTDAVL